MIAGESHSASLVLIVALCLGFVRAIAFPQWTFIGGPQGSYSNDVIFTKTGRLISSTASKGIFVSDNVGESWRNINVYPLLGSVFSMTQRANGELIALTRIGLAKSTDDGETWPVLVPRGGMDLGVRLSESPKDSNLYYSAGRQLYKSSDGGESWYALLSPTDVIDSYAVDDSGRVYAGVNESQLLMSADGGVTFHRVALPSPLSAIGISRIIPAKTGGLFLVVDRYGDDATFYVENGIAYNFQNGWLNPPLGLTTDGDLIFKRNKCFAQYIPATKASFYLSCPYFVRDQFARKVVTLHDTWVADFGAEGLHRSTDAGRSWTDINNGLGYRQSLSIEVTPHGKILTSAFGEAFWGGLYASVDDGITWSRVNPESIDAYFIDISTLKNGHLIANGSYGVCVADSEGTQWSPRTGISLGYSQYVSSSGEVFAGNDYKGISISTDNGNSWLPANNGIQHSYFFGFGESCSGRIFASAWPSGTYYSDNSGSSWTYISSGILSYERTFDFKCRNDTVYAGLSSGVAYSTDDGMTWSRCSGLNGVVRDLAITPNGHILAAVDGRGVSRSTSGGATWEPFVDGMGNRTVQELSFDRIGRLLAATDSGIFRSDCYRMRPVPSVISLQQNFPNPFNSGTVIEFDLPTTSTVLLRAYNILGQLVATIANQQFPPGSYRLPWFTSGLSSGIYFYRLEVGGFSTTRKALLLR